MNNQKFTEGPWDIDEDGDVYSSRHPERPTIAFPYYPMGVEGEYMTMDDARLTAESDSRDRALDEIHRRAGVRRDGLCGIFGWIDNMKERGGE